MASDDREQLPPPQIDLDPDSYRDTEPEPEVEPPKFDNAGKLMLLLVVAFIVAWLKQRT